MGGDDDDEYEDEEDDFEEDEDDYEDDYEEDDESRSASPKKSGRAAAPPAAALPPAAAPAAGGGGGGDEDEDDFEGEDEEEEKAPPKPVAGTPAVSSPPVASATVRSPLGGSAGGLSKPDALGAAGGLGSTQEPLKRPPSASAPTAAAATAASAGIAGASGSRPASPAVAAVAARSPLGVGGGGGGFGGGAAVDVAVDLPYTATPPVGLESSSPQGGRGSLGGGSLGGGAGGSFAGGGAGGSIGGGGGGGSWERDPERSGTGRDSEDGGRRRRSPSGSRSRSRSSSRGSRSPRSPRSRSPRSRTPDSRRSSGSRGGGFPAAGADDEGGGDRGSPSPGGGRRRPRRVEGPIGDVDGSALDMIRLVRPGNGRSAGTTQEIFDCVREGARMPGTWNASAESALDAAKSGDWPLCAYLAALCASESGPESLAEPDNRKREDFWCEVVAPIVVEVPHAEHLKRSSSSGPGGTLRTGQAPWGARPSSTRSAEGRSTASGCFRVGATLQLAGSRIKRLKLEQRHLPEVQALLNAPRGTQAEKRANQEKLTSLSRQVGLSYVSGGWFRVLAFPLAGDPSKALLRPEARGWTPHQKKAAEHIGETLMAQCAKDRRWDLVEALIRAKVPCPDLSREFDDLCGEDDAVCRHWRRDLLATVGWARRPYSILELAAWQAEKGSKGSPHFKGVLSALLEQNPDLVELTGGKACKPLIVAAAETSRWDIVLTLLDEEVVPVSVPVGAAALLESTVMETAPSGIAVQAEQRAQQECTKHARSLAEYFQHLLAGEVMTSEMVPNKYSQTGPGNLILEDANAGIRALAVGLRLGFSAACSSGGCTLRGPAVAAAAAAAAAGPVRSAVVFVAVGEDELNTAAEAVADDIGVVLPISVDGRRVTEQGPGPGWWLAVCCPECLVHVDEDSGEATLRVPVNTIPTPSIMPTVAVRVKVVSPCCHEPLCGAPVHVAGQRMGVTGEDGALSFRLPTGRWLVSAPGTSDQEAEIVADPALNEEQGEIEREIVGSGELYLYIQGNDFGKDFVMLCTNPSHVQPLPEDARSFKGEVRMSGGGGGAQKGRPRVRAGKGRGSCGQQLKTLTVRPADGKPFTANEDVAEWFDEMSNANECPLALIFNLTAKRIGDVPGNVVQEDDAASQASKANTQRSHTSLRSVDTKRRSASARSEGANSRGPTAATTILLPPGRPRPCSARTCSRPRAAQLRRLPQQRHASGLPYCAPSPLPPRPEGQCGSTAGNSRREGGCCTNPLYWQGYHNAWRDR